MGGGPGLLAASVLPLLALFTGVRGIVILGTSQVRNSANFAFTEFYEVRQKSFKYHSIAVLIATFFANFGESPEYELRVDGVLRSSAIIQKQGVGMGPSQVRPFYVLRLSVYF